MKSLFDLLNNWRTALENSFNVNIPKAVFNSVVIVIMSLLLITVIKYVVTSTPSSDKPTKKNYTIRPTSIQDDVSVTNTDKLIYRSRYRDKVYDLTGFVEYIWDFASDVSGEKLPDFKSLPDSTKQELMQESLMLIMNSQKELIEATDDKIKAKGNKN